MKLQHVVWTVAGLSLTAPGFAQEEMITQLIIQPKEFHLSYATSMNEGEMAGLRQASGVELKYARAMSGQNQVLRLPKAMTRAQAEKIVARLNASGTVRSAQIDRRMYPRLTPNDPSFVDQWHYQDLIQGKPLPDNNFGLNLPGAWDITTGSESVVVAVLDSGLLPHHDIDTDIMDGVGRVIGGYDFISDPEAARDGNARDPNPMDQGDWVDADDAECGKGELKTSSWHGTHVAGTIGALTNNGVGVSGVAWNSRLLAVRVLGKCGGLTSDIIDGMRWAAGLSVPDVPNNTHPARILNMSLGGEGECSPAEQSAVNDINNAGGIIVVAAGNEDANLNTTPSSPASCLGVLTIAATDRQGQRASYSNYGAKVDLAAPGGEQPYDTGILSTYNTGQTTPDADSYKAEEGTSMATPHVSGVLALMLSIKPDLARSEALSLLQKSATAFPDYTQNAQFNCTTSTCGAGIVNAQAVLASMQQPTPPTPTPPTPTPPTPTPTPTPSSSGGGSMEWLSLLSLFGLAALRQRRRVHIGASSR